MFIGALVKDKINGTIGIVLESKLWKYDNGDKSYQTRFHKEGQPILDFYVHWQSNELSWIAAEYVSVITP